ncbi:MAG: efflux RND transporter periplasmic adaptor subunit [Epsilonproteobacteria bacterium]|nr:efflux RND transporter periplasmic adaptor subunit [Campylobacterota bacterium]
MRKLRYNLIIAIFLSTTAIFAGGAPVGVQMLVPKADIYIVPKPAVLPITLKYPAIVKAYKKVQVVARALGILKQKYFKEGQKVNKGDLLYQIEDDIYLAKNEAAVASLQMSKANLDNAQRNWKRVKRLYTQKAVSQEKRDNASSAYQQALASVALAKAQLKQANINLAYTKVKAPISGIIGLKQVDVGDLISPNPPTPLVKITQIKKIYIDFSVPMSDYRNIKNHLWSVEKDASIKINLEVNGKILKKEAGVNFVDINTNNQTSIVKMRAVFDNSDGFLMPGQFVRVITKNIVQKGVITIPQKAVLQNPLGTIVFIENHGRVGVRPVFLGNESGNNYIVAGGPLKSGDKVIINNFFRLKPGSKVIVDKIINKQGK